MKVLRVLLSIGWLAITLATAQAEPAISPDGILNAASYVPSGLPNSGIAQGSLFVVMGSGLGPDVLQQAPGVPWPAELAETTVQVTVGETTVNAYLYYTWTGQLAGVLPSTTPVGDGTLTVTYNGETSAPAPIRVVGSALGIFTRNQAGYGPAIIQNWSPAALPVNALNEAANPGQTEIIWATGLGPIAGDDSIAPPVGPLPVNARVLVGDQIVVPTYAGRTGMGVPSIDQIQFVVPDGVEGCRVPLAVEVDGVVSNYTTMAIASSGTVCSQETGFAAADIEGLEQRGEAKIGVIAIESGHLTATTQEGTLEGTMENASGSFFGGSLTEFLAGIGYREGFSIPRGTCIVYAARWTGEPQMTPEVSHSRWFEAGDALNLTGPEGTRQIDRDGVGQYSRDELGGGFPEDGTPPPPSYLVPGQYTVDNGAGGSDVEAFEATLTLPPALEWTNRDAFTEIDRAQDLTVTWQGGNEATEVMGILGLSANTATQTSCTFFCTAAVNAGSLTVPSRVISSLPATSPWDGEAFPTGLLIIATEPVTDTVRFSAPGLDMGFFYYRNWVAKDVTFK